MKGRIVTAGQERYDLPELYSWELCCTGGVPCDSFEIECGYDSTMLPILEMACRFEAVEDGEVIFRGVVDEYGVCLPLPQKTGIGLLIEFEAPGRAKPHDDVASLLHVQPVGHTCRVTEQQRDFAVIPCPDIVAGV